MLGGFRIDPELAVETVTSMSLERLGVSWDEMRNVGGEREVLKSLLMELMLNLYFFVVVVFFFCGSLITQKKKLEI